jgi:hypothetical protein
MVYLDEAIFDEKTGWRNRAYSPTRKEGCRRLSGEDIVWGICAVMSIDGYLLTSYGTRVKEGYFDKGDFCDRLFQRYVVAVSQSMYDDQYNG